jgi:hypothetical protein
MVAAGPCSYPRAYKPPPENLRRPNKPTPAPPPKNNNYKKYYFFEMQYKTAKGRQWKKHMKFLWLSDATMDKVAKAPMLEVLQILAPLPQAATVDYFRLIKYEGEEIWPL